MNQVKKKLILIILLLFSLPMTGIRAQINQSQLHSMVVKDETLIAPGIGASSIVIDMLEDEVVFIKGKPFEKTQSVSHNFFKDVLAIKSEIQLPFNYLYTYRNPSTIVGLYNSRVSFVVVWGSYGVLIDGVNISKGIMAILFNYGNEGMKVIRDADGAIYIYASKGIAFIDEKNDDSVDGIIIFKDVSRQ